MKIKDLAVDHPYYSSESNYYSNDASTSYETWADFYEEFHDADVDMNLIFRWDVIARERSGRYRMEIFMIHQRKGIYHPILISYVDDKDADTIASFMGKHWAKLRDLWEPLAD